MSLTPTQIMALLQNQKKAELRKRAAIMGVLIKLRGVKGLAAGPAHGFPHLSRVGTYAAEIDRMLGGSPHEAELARVAGYLHDFERFPTEEKRHGQLVAEKVRHVLRQHTPYGFEEKEIKPILQAIEKHEEVPAWLKEHQSRDVVPKEEQHRIYLSLWLADKLEANGHYVLARRSAFVGGERVMEGDLAKKRFYCKRRAARYRA